MSVAVDLAKHLQQGVLDNPRHERFAQLAASGKHPDWECYQLAYGCTKEVAESHAWGLRADSGIKGRIAEIKAAQTATGIITRDEALRELTAAWRTPVGEVDEHHPLAQEVTRDAEGNVTKIKMVPKLPALEMLGKMSGWLKDAPDTIVIPIQVNIDVG
jgi:hypothetical protein